MKRNSIYLPLCSVVVAAVVFSPDMVPAVEDRSRSVEALRMLEQARAAARSITEDAFLSQSALRRIAVAQAEARRFEAALETAGMIADQKMQADAWRQIAVAQARAGDRTTAMKLLDQVLKKVGTFKNVHLIRVEALIATAEAQAQIGDVPGALKTAVTVGNLHGKAEALRNIALVQARSGNLRAALETVETITVDTIKADAWRKIALAQAESGDREGALRTVAAIRDPYMKASAFRQIAVSPLILRDRDGALDVLRQSLGVADTVKGENEKADALGGIAMAQAEAGDIAGALKTAAMMERASAAVPNPDVAVTAKGEVLRGIAIAQAKAGDSRGGSRTAAGIVSPYMQASALAEIAVAQAGRGDRSAAVATLRNAARIAAAIQESYAKSPALLAVAQAQAKVGEQAAAVKTFRQARQTVRVSADERYKTEALLEVAVAQARAGDFPGAMETAEGIQDVYAKANAWREVAAVLSGNGTVEEVLAWAARQGAPVKKAYALLGVAEGILASGKSKP